jgi:hypothetical protein
MYKTWNKIISFNIRKKRKSKTCQRKNEKKEKFESLGMSF